jgi:hypothetical protein
MAKAKPAPNAKPASKKKIVAKPAPKAKPVAKTAAKPAAKATASAAAKAPAKPVTKPPANAAAKALAKTPAKPAAKPPAKASANAVKAPTKPIANAATTAARTKPSAPPVAVDDSGLGWIDAGNGYAITLDDGKLAARNDKGKRLSSVPKEIKDGDAADQLEALRDWLVEHERECIATVDLWMLRSLSVPRSVLQVVWEDTAWRKPLENAVIVAVKADGGHDHAKAGLFRGVDPKKGVGVVDLDGETAWLETDRVAIPHPILIPDLDAWRELIGQLNVTQGIAQLHRETHVKSPEHAIAQTIDAYEDGKFAMLMHAVGKARQLGYKVRGGFATCKTWDAGAVHEARYWIGSDSPDSETYTGALTWVDGRERSLKVADVGPVAFSEGMRMASSIYAARVVEKTEAS